MTGYIPAFTLKQQLLEIIKSNEARGVPIRLSNVGLQLAKQMRAPFRALSPEPTLASFIRTHMSAEVEILPDPSSPLVLYVRRKIIPETAEIQKATEREREDGNALPRSTNSAAKPRFHKSFWAAFSKPLPAGKTRYIQLGLPFHFEDLDREAEAPEGYVVVEDNFIAPAALEQGPERSAFVFTQVEAWLEKIGYGPEMFLEPKTRTSSEYSRTSFLEILSGLDKRDLERIVLPADIWLKLIKFYRI